MKTLAPPAFRPLLWMLPGFVFTFMTFWYPIWADLRLPVEADSRMWILVGFALPFTLLAAASVLILYGRLVMVASQNRDPPSVVAAVMGLLMFLPTAGLVVLVLA